MGNPDSPTPPHIVAKLVEAVQDPRTHRYSVSKGIPGLRRALAGYYQRRFGVRSTRRPRSIATLGSKEGLANLASAITAPGDTILVPNPSYPIHQFGFIIAGAAVRSRAGDAGRRDAARAGPRGAAFGAEADGADRELPVQPDGAIWRTSISTGRSSRSPGGTSIWILSDLAYAEIYFGDKPPPSLLQVPGAKDIAVEFTTLSKTYSMPGWRMGFAAGNPRLINALTRMKSYLDYGAFTPIQVAAAAALNGPQDCVDQIRALYRERRDVLIRGLASAGWDVPSPDGSMFAWAPIPPRFAGLGSVEFSKLLLARAKVAVVARARLRRARRGLRAASRWWRTRIGCARRCATSEAFLQAGTNQAVLRDAASLRSQRSEVTEPWPAMHRVYRLTDIRRLTYSWRCASTGTRPTGLIRNRMSAWPHHLSRRFRCSRVQLSSGSTSGGTTARSESRR